MTVKEFIEELKQYDPDLLIVTNDSEYGRSFPTSRENVLEWNDYDVREIKAGMKFIEIT